MLTPLSILSPDQGPKWTATPATGVTSCRARLRSSLATLGHVALNAFAAARRFALRRGLRAG
jgi:hypothetical protein